MGVVVVLYHLPLPQGAGHLDLKDLVGGVFRAFSFSLSSLSFSLCFLSFSVQHKTRRNERETEGRMFYVVQPNNSLCSS